MTPPLDPPVWRIRGLTRPTDPIHVTRKIRQLDGAVVRVDQQITLRTSATGLDASGRVLGPVDGLNVFSVQFGQHMQGERNLVFGG
jgi:hypothetical protein